LDKVYLQASYLFAITFKNLFSAGTKVSRQSNPTVSVTMEADNQTEEEQDLENH
jgi:hypothetical protein